MGESDSFSKTCDLPSDRFEPDETILIILSNFGIDLIVHRLELFFICYSWYEQIWLFIDVSTPWFIQKLISDDVVTFTELSRNLSPEGGKFISQTVVVIVKIPYSRADGLCEVIFRPRMFSTVLSRWIKIFINWIWII